MEEATVIGCLTCFTGNTRSKNQPNRLLLESDSSNLELPSYEKLSHDPSSPIISKSCENMPHKMPQDGDSGGSKQSKWNSVGANSSSGIGTEREEGVDKVMKKSSWLPNAKGKRWPLQGWA